MAKTKKPFIKRLIYISIMVCAIFATTTVTAFADTTGMGGDLNAANINVVLSQMFGFIKTVSIPVAIIGMVMCAFAFFLPDEKGWAVAKKRILNIGIALVVLMIIPLIYRFSSGVRSVGWNPSGSNMQIISPMGDNFDMTNGPQADPG